VTTTPPVSRKLRRFSRILQASFSKGSRSQHFLGGTAAEIRGASRDRADPHCRSTCAQRLDGVEVGRGCSGRFSFDRGGEARRRLADLEALGDLFEKDRIDLVDPNAQDLARRGASGALSESYRISLSADEELRRVNPNLPTARARARKLIAEAKAPPPPPPPRPTPPPPPPPPWLAAYSVYPIKEISRSDELQRYLVRSRRGLR